VPRVRRLKQKADFERALQSGAAGVVAKGVHFVVHHVGEAPAPGADDSPAGELSTGRAAGPAGLVDDVCEPLPAPGPGLRVGVVLPKRWARRSVTRSLIKRQVFAAAERRAADMPAGVWVVRLRAAFDRQQFPSAASQALKAAVRAELDALLTQAVRRLRRAGRARG
jgi:ribonuclease P protein component